MQKLKKLLLWYLLLTKRLIKKPVFIIILIMIPVLVLSLNLIAKQDSGVLTIALAQEDTSDEMSCEIINSITEEKSLIKYIYCTPEEAERAVKEGTADSAWIFRDNIKERIDTLVTDISKRNYIVTVVEREHTVPVLLSHEKLAGVLYTACSESLYLQFARNNTEELKALSDDELMKYYNEIHKDGRLFEYCYSDSDASAQQVIETDLLVTPIRGILSVLVILCGLACAMFFMQDEEKGTFAWVSYRVKPFMAFGYHFTAIILVAVAMFVSLAIIGVSTSFLREIIMIILYTLACTGFCMVIRLLCSNIKVLAVLTPFIVIALIAICPVFLDFKILRPVQALLPPYYYLNALYSNSYLIYMLLYAVAAFITYALISKLKNKA
ncbi:MAG: ABC transporter permease [Acutalibacteraceae bacterium]|nr:ABC transporter permease [Acutalibacteraceae bacterium]